MKIKRKLLIFLVGLFSFVVLFYNREPGLNVFIFCAIAWLLAIISLDGFKAFKSDTGFWALSLAVGLTAGAFTYYGDPGSMFCLLLSFYALGVYLTDRKFQIILYPLLLAYSFGTFIVRIFFVDRWIPQRSHLFRPDIDKEPERTDSNVITSDILFTPTKPSHTISWVRTWLLPIIIAIFFLVVYMFSSSMFADVLTKLLPDLDFGVIFALSLLGFFLLFNFMYLLPIPWLYTINEKVLGWDTRRDETAGENKQTAAHQKGAIITLSLLIALLIPFLLIYGYELYQGIHAARLSAAVHEQVNSVILSIVMAVAVIMYYIRPDHPNTVRNKKSRLLRKLAYCWVILNIILVVSAALHNTVYIQRYGLTLLRVGVYIFLLLSMIGLYFTYRKIRDHQSAGYLVSVMFKIIFGTIILNSTVNWSAIVTRYDLAYMATPDIAYLSNLDYNVHILYPHLKSDPKLKNIPYRDRYLKSLKDEVKLNASYPIISAALYYKCANRQILRGQ
ncbi:DUF4153 domain-containing protein [Arachidicoccus terrestris]|uniref:DUF4153 domain-containing protein n=1 Tax=Arachidicoccus terrestris TaxID=2875539 RepID=UPI001CC3CBDB|nr:DUF4153 domain-containing protein [Arachidicoccus terrestris]UAY54125.1 DUF4173 domain-containing protein [Arachidicoccus terrestris]